MWKLNLGILILLFACSGEVTNANAQESSNQGDTTNVTADDKQTVKVDSKNYDYDFKMLLGHFKPEEHADYVIIDPKYADRAGLYLHKDTYAAFIKMHTAAKRDSINLQIKSATRNFAYQKGIWERKWTGETKVRGEDISKTISDPKTRALKILEYSSMPGTSRHHWGSDIDLNSFSNKWFETGEGRQLWDWLEENAIDYGFCRPYTAKDSKRPDGYQEERWHWSYMPLSSYFMSMAEKRHSDGEISGFMGAEVAGEIDVVLKYVFGVNSECYTKN